MRSSMFIQLVDARMSDLELERPMSKPAIDAQQLAKLRKMAWGISLNFWLGVVGCVLSFFESSGLWTVFIVLTAWIGVVMGLTGGPGFADYLLNRIPPHRQISKGLAFILGLVTFWIPTLSVAVFGLVLAGALREDLQPQSHLDDKSFSIIFQVFAMYFLSAGTCWAIVGKEVKRVQRALEAS